MSTTERSGTQSSESPVTGDGDETTEGVTAHGTGAPSPDHDPVGANKPHQSKASSMRDAAMARVAPQQDLSARRSAAARATQAADESEPGAAAGIPRARKGRRTGPRRVRLTIRRIDPWSVFKISLLVAVGLGIATVITVGVLWTVLSGMDVFSTIDEFIVQVTSGEDEASQFDLMQYIGLGRVLSLTVVFAVANVLLLTALATLSAFLYNVCSALVGGAHLTLSDE